MCAICTCTCAVHAQMQPICASVPCVRACVRARESAIKCAHFSAKLGLRAMCALRFAFARECMQACKFVFACHVCVRVSMCACAQQICGFVCELEFACTFACMCACMCACARADAQMHAFVREFVFACPVCMRVCIRVHARVHHFCARNLCSRAACACVFAFMCACACACAGVRAQMCAFVLELHSRAMCACACVCAHVRAQMRAFVREFVFACRVCMRVCICAWVRANVCVSILICIRVHARVHVCLHVFFAGICVRVLRVHVCLRSMCARACACAGVRAQMCAFVLELCSRAMCA